MSALENAKAMIRAREDAARRLHGAQAARSSGVCWSGMGPGPFVELTEEQVEREAAELLAREAARAPDVVLKVALRHASEAGSLDAKDILAAADRGSPGWQDRAREFLGRLAEAA